jgi:hypothetical protein
VVARSADDAGPRTCGHRAVLWATYRKPACGSDAEQRHEYALVDALGCRWLRLPADEGSRLPLQASPHRRRMMSQFRRAAQLLLESILHTSLASVAVGPQSAARSADRRVPKTTQQSFPYGGRLCGTAVAGGSR